MKTAEYVIAAGGEPSLLGQCYFAAYESDTSAMNYLKVLLNGCEHEGRKELQKVFMKYQEVQITVSLTAMKEVIHALRGRKTGTYDIV